MSCFLSPRAKRRFTSSRNGNYGLCGAKIKRVGSSRLHGTLYTCLKTQPSGCWHMNSRSSPRRLPTTQVEHRRRPTWFDCWMCFSGNSQNTSALNRTVGISAAIVDSYEHLSIQEVHSRPCPAFGRVALVSWPACRVTLIKPAAHSDEETAKCPESLCPLPG